MHVLLEMSIEFHNIIQISSSDPVKYLDKCVAACKKTACKSEWDVQNGCEHMFTCVHACKIRNLGVNEDQCRNHCDRTYGSGCSPVVNGYQFGLCDSCYPSRNGCSPRPTVAECELGCATYGNIYFVIFSFINPYKFFDLLIIFIISPLSFI